MPKIILAQALETPYKGLRGFEQTQSQDVKATIK